MNEKKAAELKWIELWSLGCEADVQGVNLRSAIQMTLQVQYTVSYRLLRGQ
jgi:hypothetical protein